MSNEAKSSGGEVPKRFSVRLSSRRGQGSAVGPRQSREGLRLVSGQPPRTSPHGTRKGKEERPYVPSRATR